MEIEASAIDSGALDATQKQESARAALGIRDIDVRIACTACYHDHEKHEEEAGKNHRGKCSGALNLESGEVPCPCPGFKGDFPDGSPRMLRFRQLTHLEYATIHREVGLPVYISEDVSQLTPEEIQTTTEWGYLVAAKAGTHIRTFNDEVGAPAWHKVKLLAPGEKPEDEDDPWAIPIEHLDLASPGLSTICTAALLADYRGLPAGVVLLQPGARFPGHQSDGGGGPLPDGDGTGEDAPRATDGGS